MFRKRSATLTALVALAAVGCSDGTSPVGPISSPDFSMSSESNVWVETVTGAAHSFGTLNGVPFPRNIQFNARRAADGTVAGHFQLNTGIVTWRGPVLCFEIVDETTVRLGGLAATVIDPKGIVFGDTPPPQGILEVATLVSDHGEGSGDPADTTSPVFIGGPGTAAAGCAGEFDGAPDVELSSGNVQIHRR
jgi:hypothetical protein